ncbi:MarR family transcriptional regulator [Lachnospiraceae bacterium]|jgi:DNA-binding MarR family transcriptional regulator|nr:MarR family transcriptional regulator [Lachnospiraceae bacterium]
MDEKQCASSVLGLANQIKRVFDTMTGRCGTQIRILNFVLVSYPDREIYQKDIEEELNIRSASVSTHLKKMEAQDFIRREKVSYDDRLKKILPTNHTVEMKEQVERHITLLEKRLTAGIEEKELKVFFDVLKKMQENMELMEKGDRYG